MYLQFIELILMLGVISLILFILNSIDKKVMFFSGFVLIIGGLGIYYYFGAINFAVGMILSGIVGVRISENKRFR